MSAAVQMPVHVLYHDPQRRADETDTKRSPQSQSPGFAMVSPRYPMPRVHRRAPSTADRPPRQPLRHHNRHRGSIILHPQPQIPRRNRHSGPITRTEGATTCTLDHDYPATRPPEKGQPPPRAHKTAPSTTDRPTPKTPHDTQPTPHGTPISSRSTPPPSSN